MKITLQTEDLATVVEVSKKLKVSRMTLYRWIKNGKILAVRLDNKTFFPISEIERLSKER